MLVYSRLKTRYWLFSVVAALFVGMCCVPSTYAGDLESFANDAEKKPKRKKRDRDRHHHHDPHCDGDDDSLGSFLGDLIGALLFASVSGSSDDCHDDSVTISGDSFVFTIVGVPWIGPQALLGDSSDFEADFPEFPYQNDTPGYLSFQSQIPEYASSSGFQFSTEYGSNFSGTHRIGTHLLWEGSSRWGLDAEVNHWIEEIPSGNDQLSMGDLNLVYRFAQSERVQFRSGLGVNWMGYEGNGEAGFNFTYGVDLYPADPWAVRSSIDWGTIGSSQLFHARSTVGLMLDRFEIFTGYDYRRLGPSDFQGWVSGVNIYF